jgi:DNA-binding transcriptional regulator YdaS (Cro superfamily)
MGYGKDLLDRAAAKAGSRYALSKVTGIPESNLSEATHGKRNVPASWVLKLARVAEIDPTEAMEMHDLERAEKKRLRRHLSRLGVAGVAAICATLSSSGDGLAHQFSAATSRVEFTVLNIVSKILAWATRRQQRTIPSTGPAWQC